MNSYLLWVDAYESPNALAERMSLSEARAAYLKTHSVPDLVRRELTGLAGKPSSACELWARPMGTTLEFSWEFRFWRLACSGCPPRRRKPL